MISRGRVVASTLAVALLLVLGAASAAAAALDEQRITAPSEGAGHRFGASTAVDGDLSVIGEPGYGATGRVTIIEGDGNITPIDGIEDDSAFGTAVAVADGRVFVGAPDAGSGAVHVFERSDDGAWVLAETITGQGAADGTNPRFGAAVAADVNMVVIGAPFDGTAGAFAGTVEVYVMVGGNWVVQPLSMRSDAPGELLGSSVAIEGTTIAAGAPGAAGGQGLVYHLQQDDLGGGWLANTTIVSGDVSSGYRFGTSVAVTGGRIIVGAVSEPAGDVSSLLMVGEGERAEFYVYEIAADSWTTIVSETSGAGDSFGSRMAAHDGTVFVSAPTADGPDATNTGAVMQFIEDVDGWIESVVVAGDGAGGDQFGSAVASDGSTLLVGAVGADGAFDDAGAAYRYTEGEPQLEPVVPIPAVVAGNSAGPDIIATFDEPGDDAVVIPVHIYNQAEFGVGDAVLSGLVDSRLGDILAADRPLGFTTCKEGTAVPGGMSIFCTFVYDLEAGPGDVIHDVTATLSNEAGEATNTDSTVVVVQDIPSSIEVVASAAVTEPIAPGTEIELTIRATNTSAVDEITMTDVTPVADECVLPQTVEIGGFLECTALVTVTGEPGSTVTVDVQAGGVDSDGIAVSGDAQFVVELAEEVTPPAGACSIEVHGRWVSVTLDEPVDGARFYMVTVDRPDRDRDKRIGFMRRARTFRLWYGADQVVQIVPVFRGFVLGDEIECGTVTIDRPTNRDRTRRFDVHRFFRALFGR